MTSQVTKVTYLKVFNMSKSKIDFDLGKIDKALLSSFQKHKTEIKLLFDRYTLRDTGNLINTSEAIDTDSGIAIEYTADYAPYVYRIKTISTQVKTLGSFIPYKPTKSIGGERNWRNESRLYNYPYNFINDKWFIGKSNFKNLNIYKEE